MRRPDWLLSVLAFLFRCNVFVHYGVALVCFGVASFFYPLYERFSKSGPLQFITSAIDESGRQNYAFGLLWILVIGASISAAIWLFLARAFDAALDGEFASVKNQRTLKMLTSLFGISYAWDLVTYVSVLPFKKIIFSGFSHYLVANVKEAAEMITGLVVNTISVGNSALILPTFRGGTTLFMFLVSLMTYLLVKKSNQMESELKLTV